MGEEFCGISLGNLGEDSQLSRMRRGHGTAQMKCSLSCRLDLHLKSLMEENFLLLEMELERMDVKRSIEEGEKRFNKLSIEERGKFDEETLVNVNSIKRQSTSSQRTSGFSNEYIVLVLGVYISLILVRIAVF
ncbi:DUF1517 domain-containing protein [Cucumis melo var. makuwa]|uniref:DUF1517 domain-containing protein n=1 Tax=Cucumis melo var. makuwa TaxID=1194695 RepID=A0A5D3E0V7_CUCMM|nr:DUF1517 domain-containing protein [Cucumis melo var. makuwa]